MKLSSWFLEHIRKTNFQSEIRIFKFYWLIRETNNNIQSELLQTAG